MERLLSAARAVSRLGLWLGGALVLLSAIVIGIDVVMRKAFALSIGGADELAGFALAIGTAWGLGATLLDRAHIRIDSLYLWLPVWLRALLDHSALVAFTAVFGLIFWHGIGVMTQSLTAESRSMSALQTPLALPQGAWLVGFGLFLVTALLLLLRALGMAARRDLAGVIGLIGVRTTEEETAEEVRSAEAIHGSAQAGTKERAT